MAAVDVILTAEQRGGFVEQGGWNGRKIAGQAVDLLVDVRFHQMKDAAFRELIDDAEWTITTLTHTVSPDNGFTTSLELEVRIDDFEME